MNVIGLCGRSGTGKSHHALSVAREMKIEAIVDDGLLIAGNRILAGRSAKAERTKMAAVRRAIFQDESQASDVRSALAAMAPQSILILGTSHGMLEEIRAALQLPEYARILEIEELASPEDLQTARLLRDEEGTHVIPVARSEVRRLIPVALVDAFDSVFRSSRGEISRTSEQRTQVKPHFSDNGSAISVNPDMIRPLIERALEESGNAAFRLGQVTLQMKPSLIIQLEISALPSGLDLLTLRTLQHNVRERVQGATGQQIQSVDVVVGTLLKRAM